MFLEGSQHRTICRDRECIHNADHRIGNADRPGWSNVCITSVCRNEAPPILAGGICAWREADKRTVAK